MRTACGLAAHGRGLSQAKHDGIRRRARLESRGNPGNILALDGDTRRMQHPALRQGRAQTRRHGDMTVRIRGAPPRAAHLGRRIGEWADHGEMPQ